MNEIVLFIFRRDLRFNDNLGLNHAIKYSKKHKSKLMLCFTFTNEQIKTNPYFSSNAYQFMIESLMKLKSKLSVFDDKDFYKDIDNVKAIFFNKDYTPYSIKRDNEIKEYCEKKNIVCEMFEDYTLLPIDSIKNQSGNPYNVFTPFYKKCLEESTKIPKPVTESFKGCKVVKKQDSLDLDELYKNENKFILSRGGRLNGKKILRDIELGKYKNYVSNRDVPSMEDGTTRLSPYLKFGCVSLREVFYVVLNKHGLQHDLIKQLFWKEFYAMITYHYGYVLGGMISDDNNESFNKKYDKIEWSNKKEWYDRWCEGKTGVPIVDAGMRQLNKTGYMHNRLRMITASFLIKDLLIDWREGERYFATKLVDYDPASNNGGWQWVAGSGTDAAPYFRVFNPWLQMTRFDKECKYVKKWIPELINVSCEHLLKWEKKYKEYEVDYPKPIIENHGKQKEEFIDLYKSVL